MIQEWLRAQADRKDNPLRCLLHVVDSRRILDDREESSFVDAAMQPRSVEKSTEGLVAGRLEVSIFEDKPDKKKSD